MRFLLDQGLPRSTVRELADRGLTAEHVGDLGLATATDDEILVAARNRNAVLVTLDADFHTILALEGAKSPSVIRIRVEGLKGAGAATIIEQVHADAQKDLEDGVAVSVTIARFRIRRLPLV